MKRFLTLFTLLTAVFITASAYDFMVDGIAYKKNSDGKSVTVTYTKQSPAYNDVGVPSQNIPGNVYYNGRSYAVTSIGEYAFYGCGRMTSITIPNSVTTIGSCAFQKCSKLASITIPNSVTSIGSSAFSGCSSLTSITIPSSITKLEDLTFSQCTSLTSITIPNSVTSIGRGAFSKCTSLTSITIPNSVTSIGAGAFENTVLKEINISCTDNDDFVKYLKRKDIYSIFYKNEFENASHNICIAGKKQTDITIPNSITTIENYAFKHCSGLTSVTIPNSVTTIDKYAFAYCSGLTSITLPNSVTSIGDYAFCDCSGLISLSIPSSVKSIGLIAFSRCTSLTSVTFPYSTTAISIGQTAFGHCNNLKSVTISNPSTTIDKLAFYKCTSLTSVNIHNTVTSLVIGENAFEQTELNEINISCKDNNDFAKYLSRNDILDVFYSGLFKYKLHNIYINGKNQTSVIIPNSVKSIGSCAFSECSSLTSITIPNSVTSIGSSAFYSCSSLTSITIPKSVTSIKGNTFLYCNKLTSIKVEEGNIHYDSRNNCNAIIETSSNTLLSGCSNTIIPNSVTSIGSSAFEKCSSLTSITIPKSVTSIGDSAFYKCNRLTSITIPKSVTSIGNYAFYTERISDNYKTSISNVYSLMENVTSAVSPKNLFQINVSFHQDKGWYDVIDATLYVPDNCINSYKETYPWKMFRNIKGLSESGVNDIHVDEDDRGLWYDLNGRIYQEKPLDHGIYIHNGKKELVR